jgi:hypothetical protein
MIKETNIAEYYGLIRANAWTYTVIRRKAGEERVSLKPR